MSDIKSLTKKCGLVREVDKDLNSFLKRNGNDFTPFIQDIIGYDHNNNPIILTDLFTFSLYLYGAKIEPKRQFHITFYCSAFNKNQIPYTHWISETDFFKCIFFLDYEYKPIRNKDNDYMENPYHFQLSVKDSEGNKIPRQIRKSNELTFFPDDIDFKKAEQKVYCENLAKFILCQIIPSYRCKDETSLVKWNEELTTELLKFEVRE